MFRWSIKVFIINDLENGFHNWYYCVCVRTMNECATTVLCVTFINRAFQVDPPSGYSRLGSAASIINVVMVTVVAIYITGTRFTFFQRA